MGQQTTQQQQSAIAQTPSWLTPYYQTGANQATAAQSALPSISSLYNQVPLLQTAPLSSQETGVINQFPSNIAPTAAANAGVSGLENFTSQAPGTPSTATMAALNEFNQLQAPEILNQASLAGLGQSGGALGALAQGQEQALVPFMQGDLANQLSASQALGSQGIAQQGATGTALDQALAATDLPRQIQQQRYQNLYNQQQGQFNYATGLQQGPISGFPSLIGQIQNMSASLGQPKF